MSKNEFVFLNVFEFYHSKKGAHFWMAAALLICAGTFVFLIATLCSCGAIKENSHIILMVSDSIA